MHRKFSLVATFASVFLFLFVTHGAERPNILFIFADDQCFDTINRLGNREVQTPNLDRLVKSGTTFTHAYNMGAWSGAVCVPSRTMLNTGRFLWPTRQLDKNLEPERAAGRLWALEMKRAGYDTYMTGKWHLKTDAKKVFDVTQHIREGCQRISPRATTARIKGRSMFGSRGTQSSGVIGRGASIGAK